MKSPDEIKKGLECCQPKWDGKSLVPTCDECPYIHEGHWCRNVLFGDLRRYTIGIEQRLAQVERERDAAVRELKLGEDCDNCKHRNECKHDGFGYKKCTECGECPCSKCEGGESQYEWRGVCAENSKGDDE